MIVVSHNSGEIKIEGHAEYAPEGQDIVCAGVSALTQGLVLSLEKLTDDKIEYAISPGKVGIHYGNLSEKAQSLIDSFFIGICAVIDEYPDYVRTNHKFYSECRGHENTVGTERNIHEI